VIGLTGPGEIHHPPGDDGVHGLEKVSWLALAGGAEPCRRGRFRLEVLIWVVDVSMAFGCLAVVHQRG
jgi:hypothetical protein